MTSSASPASTAATLVAGTPLAPVNASMKERRVIIPNSRFKVRSIPQDFNATKLPDHFFCIQKAGNGSLVPVHIEIPQLTSILTDEDYKVLILAVRLINNFEQPEYEPGSDGMNDLAVFPIEIERGGSKQNLILEAAINAQTKTLTRINILRRTDELGEELCLTADFNANVLPSRFRIVRPVSGTSLAEDIKIPRFTMPLLPEEHQLLCRLLTEDAWQIDCPGKPEYRELFDYEHDLYKFYGRSLQDNDTKRDLVVEVLIDREARSATKFEIIKMFDNDPAWGLSRFSLHCYDTKYRGLKDDREMRQWRERFTALFGPCPHEHPDPASDSQKQKSAQ